MSGFLLDTNVISEVVRPRADRRVLQWMETADEERLFLSVLTVWEIRKGIALLTHSKRRTQLETWLEVDLRERFSHRILPVDQDVADRWGLLAATAQRRGKPLPVIDALLAATALQHNLTVVSRNAVDFGDTPVQVLNPWQP